jgi:hypothetical protein
MNAMQSDNKLFHQLASSVVISIGVPSFSEFSSISFCNFTNSSFSNSNVALLFGNGIWNREYSSASSESKEAFHLWKQDKDNTELKTKVPDMSSMTSV